MTRTEEIMRWELPVAVARLRESVSDDEKKILLELVNQKLMLVEQNDNKARRGILPDE